MNQPTVSIIDAGAGNLHSVSHALASIGAKVNIIQEPEQLQEAQRLVLPGVGAFGAFMDGLQARQLIPMFMQAVQRGDPILGICVGMQAFFEKSEEMGEHQGLGILAGTVKRFPPRAGFKIPHTGWNDLTSSHNNSRLLRKLTMTNYVYFNHSYYCAATPEDTASRTDYILPFTSIVERDNICGVQFHPEKSQFNGLRILENFLTL